MQLPRRRKSKVDKLIDVTLSNLENHDPGSQEYEDRLKVVERLDKLKASATQRVSWDTVITVLGQLMITLIVVLHEEKHVITTKALNFFPKKS